MTQFRPARSARRARQRHRRRDALAPVPPETPARPPQADAAVPAPAPSQAASEIAPAARAAAPARGRGAMTERGAPRLRRNVGLVIRNREGKVLAGLRAHASGDKAWQLPQGGIEGRERPATAAYRELREETGIDPRAVRLVRELEGWIDYHLPADFTLGRRFVGQTQKWFLFDYLEPGLPDLRKATDKEFEQLAWLELEWLIHHVIAFRKPVYKAVKKAFHL